MKELPAHHGAGDFDVARCSAHLHGSARKSGHILKDIVAVFQGAKHGRAEAVVWIGVVGAGKVNHGKFIGVRHRQRPQQQAVDEREDRGVGAQTQSQRQNRGERKAGRSHQCSGGVSQVTPEVFDCPDGVLLPQALSNALRIAELYYGLASRFVLRHATRHVLGDLLIQIEIDFLQQLGIRLSPAKEPEPLHTIPPSA